MILDKRCTSNGERKSCAPDQLGTRRSRDSVSVENSIHSEENSVGKARVESGYVLAKPFLEPQSKKLEMIKHVLREIYEL